MSRIPLAANPPSFVLLDHETSIANIENNTTAYGLTILGRVVGVSFSHVPPPYPSKFILHFPGVNEEAPDKNILENDKHHVLATHRGVALLQLSVSNPVIRRMGGFALEHFVYRAVSKGQRPWLFLIPDWPHSLMDIGGGYSTIFSSDYKSFDVVALRPLLPGQSEYEYDVCVFSSREWAWTKKHGKLQLPRMEKHRKCALSHVSCKVITLEAGCVCWVDLNCGILLCNNVFSEESMLNIRYMPLPEAMLRNNTSHPFVDIACSFRDISGYCGHEIRFVHVENGMRYGLGYKISFWTNDALLEKEWDEQFTGYLDIDDLRQKVPKDLDLDFVLSTAVPRLSLEKNNAVYLISKQCNGLVIAVDIVRRTPLTPDCKCTGSMVAYSFCTDEISCDTLSWWQVPSPCLNPERKE